MKRIKKLLLLLSAALVLVLAAIPAADLALELKTVRFYAKAPYWHVSEANRAAVLAVYEAHADVLTKVRAAEDSRTHAVIRVAFTSGEPLPEDTRRDILASLRARMEAHLTEQEGLWPLDSWEVFFSAGDRVDSVWLARLEREGDALRYTDWQESRDAEAWMTPGDIRLLMRHTLGHGGAFSFRELQNARSWGERILGFYI